jgi:transposase
MAGRRKDVLDIREIVRRFGLGERDRRIARDMGTSRNTIAKYREWAAREGFLEAELPAPGVIEERLKAARPPREPGPASSVEPFRAFVVEKREAGVELRALHALLGEKGFEGSYSALRRFVWRLEDKSPETFLRIETAPGEEAQVDFGYAGLFHDPLTKRMRKTWIFVMTLSYSRHQYVELVFDQKVETWVELHVRAFEWFDGVVKRVILDNLKAGIVKAVLYDSEAQRSYRELAEHYGFLISPCRPRTPRHKGKVESGVRFVRRNGLAGRLFSDIHAGNDHLRHWAVATAGVRDHGTTHEQPLIRFEREKPHLKPLPPVRYEVTVWHKAKVHPDCHLVLDYSYYSAPHRLVGQELWIRATARRVEVYHEHERVATHPRAIKRGTWSTIRDHLPPEKLQGLLPEPVRLKAEAQEVGPATTEFIERLLGERPLDRLRGAQGVLRLGRRYGPKRLEAACRRSLDYNQVHYQTVKLILKRELDLEPASNGSASPGPIPKTAIFARSVSELFAVNA